MQEDWILDILDSKIGNDGNNEELKTFAKLAYRCLNLKGRKRASMKQVAAELESLRMLNESAIVHSTMKMLHNRFLPKSHYHS